MGAMQEERTGTPVEFCYRHPREQTGVHCTRCERPICPECMIPAPVGYQCPECVARARREFREGPGRRVRTARARLSATRALLVVILAVYVIEIVVGGPNALVEGPSGQKLFELGAMFPLAIANGQWWRLFTSMFLHEGLFHIAFNAYALWIFGTVVEDALGSARFLLIFFVTGFLASATSYAFGPVTGLSVGASGAIFGVFGAFVAYNFRRRHLAQAAANLRGAMLLILLNALLAFAYGRIDWRAHVGGFVAGLAAGYLAEGWGTRRQRTAVTVIGFCILFLAGIALVAVRTAQIQALPLYQQLFD
jgi:membrane associated rhomboid family serine protease